MREWLARVAPGAASRRVIVLLIGVLTLPAALSPQAGAAQTVSRSSTQGILYAPAYQQAVLNDNPVSYWRLDEMTGSIAHDQRGIADGSISGGVTLNQLGPTAGGAAMAFDGSTGQVSISPTSALTTPQSWTVEAWFMIPSGTSGSQAGTLFYDASGGFGYALEVTAGGLLVGDLCTVNGCSSLCTSSSVVDGGWWYVNFEGTTVPQNGFSQDVNLNWVEPDGTTVWSSTSGDSCPTGTPFSVNGVMLGQNPACTCSAHYNGMLSEVAYYNYELSTQQEGTHVNAAGDSLPSCSPDQLPDVGTPCLVPDTVELLGPSTAQLSCQPSAGSRNAGGGHDGEYETLGGGPLGGIYADVSGSQPWVDSASNPPTSAWVMLQAPKNGNNYAQAGWFQYPPGAKLNRTWFTEVNDGSSSSPGFVHTESEFAIPPETDYYSVQVPLYTPNNVPTSPNPVPQPLQVYRFFRNGRAIVQGALPVTDILNSGVVSSEVHVATDPMPGSAAVHQTFTDIHLYYDALDGTGAHWQPWGYATGANPLTPNSSSAPVSDDTVHYLNSSGYDNFETWDLAC